MIFNFLYYKQVRASLSNFNNFCYYIIKLVIVAKYPQYISNQDLDDKKETTFILGKQILLNYKQSIFRDEGNTKLNSLNYSIHLYNSDGRNISDRIWFKPIENSLSCLIDPDFSEIELDKERRILIGKFSLRLSAININLLEISILKYISFENHAPFISN